MCEILTYTLSMLFVTTGCCVFVGLKKVTMGDSMIADHLLRPLTKENIRVQMGGIPMMNKKCNKVNI